MEQARLLIAIVLSAAVFLVWQFFFVDRQEIQKSVPKTAQPPAKTEPAQPYTAEQEGTGTETTLTKSAGTETTVAQPAEIAKLITVDTPLYTGRDLGKGRGIDQLHLEKLQRNGCQGFSSKRNHSTAKYI